MVDVRGHRFAVGTAEIRDARGNNHTLYLLVDERVVDTAKADAVRPILYGAVPVLLAANRLYLHIEGAEKQTVLQRALTGEGEGKDYPMRTVLDQAGKPVEVFSCP